MPRYVLLLHETPPGYPRPTHWDFMLEDDAALLTWALEDALTLDKTVAAEKLNDHRLAYLDYEGPVSPNESGDRGHVRQCDAGQFEWLQRSNDFISVRLRDGRSPGTVTLTRITDGNEGDHETGDDVKRWRVSLRKS